MFRFNEAKTLCGNAIKPKLERLGEEAERVLSRFFLAFLFSIPSSGYGAGPLLGLSVWFSVLEIIVICFRLPVPLSYAVHAGLGMGF